MRSSERAQSLGEVFTQPRDINAILDWIADQDYASRYLEPGCGSGNFLAEEGSLHYAGGREYDLKIGGWDTTVSRDEAIEIVGKLDAQLGVKPAPRRRKG